VLQLEKVYEAEWRLLHQSMSVVFMTKSGQARPHQLKFCLRRVVPHCSSTL